MSLFVATKAKREQVKLMIGLDGPTGAGKTLSALKMAHGITGDWSKIAIADTENKSSLYYAGDITSNDWEHIDFDANIPGGYSPKNYVAIIDYAETLPIDVLIIDSISHEWNGAGGCLDLVNQYSKTSKGNTFAPWKFVTPMHDAFIDKMRTSKLHIIATMRSKQDYILEENEKGKKVPKKVGMASIQREGVDYEFGVIFNIDLSHYASVEKDRTNLFIDRPPFIIDEMVGKELAEWSMGGVETKYIGTAAQKKSLMKMAPEADAATLKQLHTLCLNKPLANVAGIVNEYFEQEKA